MTAPDDFFPQLKAWTTDAARKLESFNFTEINKIMFLIRGTSLVYGHFQIAHVTLLGECVSSYAIRHKGSRSKIKKYFDCLWDVVTTLEYMISHGLENTTEELQILIFRLEATLKSFEEYAPPLNQAEIDIIVRSHERGRDLARSNS
jgi:hypothetical protein